MPSSQPSAVSFFRRHRWKLIAFAVICSLAIPPFKTFVIDYSFARAELDAACASLDAVDPKWRLADVDAGRGPVADEKNSALVVMKAWKALPENVKWRCADKIDNRVAPQTILLPADVYQELIDDLALRRDALAIARSIKNYPAGRYPIEYTPDYISTLVPGQAHCRLVFNLLEYDMLRHLQEAEFDEAEQSLLAMWNTARSIGDEPSLITQLARIAMVATAVESLERMLAQGFLLPESLRAWRQRLQVEIDEELFFTGLRGDCAGVHQCMTSIESGETSLRGNRPFPAQGFEDRFNTLLARNGVMRSHAWFLRRVPDVLATRPLPTWERRIAIARIQNELATEVDANRQNQLSSTALLGFCKMSDSEIRTDARLQCAHAALAAEEFRLTYNRWPKSIDEMVDAEFLPSVPKDPFDGNPLRFRRTKDGVVIYSISKTGENRGDIWDNPDLVFPEMLEGRLEFRLWDEPLRRKKSH